MKQPTLTLRHQQKLATSLASIISKRMPTVEEQKQQKDLPKVHTSHRLAEVNKKKHG